MFWSQVVKCRVGIVHLGQRYTNFSVQRISGELNWPLLYTFVGEIRGQLHWQKKRSIIFFSFAKSYFFINGLSTNSVWIVRK